MKRFIPLALFALAAACAGCSSKVTGSVTSTGGPLGTFQFTPARCESGQRWQFFGVAFFSDGDKGSRVEVVQDPLRGWFVKVAKPGTDKMTVFGEADCKVLDAQVNRTHTTVNGIRVVEGSLKFECDQSKDGVVKGELQFSGCS